MGVVLDLDGVFGKNRGWRSKHMKPWVCFQYYSGTSGRSAFTGHEYLCKAKGIWSSCFPPRSFLGLWSCLWACALPGSISSLFPLNSIHFHQLYRVLTAIFSVGKVLNLWPIWTVIPLRLFKSYSVLFFILAHLPCHWDFSLFWKITHFLLQVSFPYAHLASPALSDYSPDCDYCPHICPSGWHDDSSYTRKLLCRTGHSWWWLSLCPCHR